MSSTGKDSKRRRTGRGDSPPLDIKLDREKIGHKERKTMDLQQGSSENTAAPTSESAGVASQVASHYNEVPEAGRAVRKQSRIFYMRNFNNWIKSALINDFMAEIKSQRPGRIVALDLCCGKGGDLLKWSKAGIHHLICADIAGTSVDQCKSRYDENRRKSRDRTYSAEFYVADCTRARLRDFYEDKNVKLNLVSCQFSFHYCFESYEQTMTMLKNVSESLKSGGYFICTTLNSNELVKRWRESDSNSFGNEVYRVSFDSEDKDDVPLFGARYKFYLEGSVMDCPEFLVNFPLLVKLAEQHGLELVYRKTFEDYFKESVKNPEYRSLLNKMSAMEPYPLEHGEPASSLPEDYEHARVRLDELVKEQPDQERKPKLGTLTKAEWEAITLYIVCAFKKKSDSSCPEEPRGHKRSHEDGDGCESEEKRAAISK